MVESLEHLTTSYILPEAEGYTSLRRRVEARRLLLASEVGKRYGMWTIINRPIPLSKAQKLWAICAHCQKAYLVNLSDMKVGRSTACKGAARTNAYYAQMPKGVARTLCVRYNRIQGATNPTSTNPAYASYRARGIQNRFRSCEGFVRYVWETLPHPTYRGMEIDRIDNDGHYEPGNLQLATRLENAQNRSCNIVVEYMGRRMSASMFHRAAGLTCHHSTTLARLKAGSTPEEIISRFMTSSTPALEIDSPPTA
jgi:hypothetical protein